MKGIFLFLIHCSWKTGKVGGLGGDFLRVSSKRTIGEGIVRLGLQENKTKSTKFPLAQTWAAQV